MKEFTQKPTGYQDTISVHFGEKLWMGSITAPIDHTSTFVLKDVVELTTYPPGGCELTANFSAHDSALNSFWAT